MPEPAARPAPPWKQKLLAEISQLLSGESRYTIVFQDGPAILVARARRIEYKSDPDAAMSEIESMLRQPRNKLTLLIAREGPGLALWFAEIIARDADRT